MRLATNLPKREGGTTLLIALVFLVILTLFAVSGMNTGVINLRTANNAQMMVEAEFAAQQQIEARFNSAANFHFDATVPPAIPWPATTTTTNVDVNGDAVTDFVIVTTGPKCVNVRDVSGEYSDEVVKSGSAPREHVWQVTAVSTDSIFGTTATVRQGVKIRLTPNWACVP
jgi:Tfp pilus assembly protein PilX